MSETNPNQDNPNMDYEDMFLSENDDSSDKIIAVIEELAEEIPEEKRRIINQLLISSKSAHRGPLPPARELKIYAQIIPNGAERLMKMVEKEAANRQYLQNKIVTHQIIQSYLGQVFGLLIGITVISCATFCILQGYQLSGAILGISGLTGLVSIFVVGKRLQHKKHDK